MISANEALRNETKQPNQSGAFHVELELSPIHYHVASIMAAKEGLKSTEWIQAEVNTILDQIYNDGPAKY